MMVKMTSDSRDSGIGGVERVRFQQREQIKVLIRFLMVSMGSSGGLTVYVRKLEVTHRRWGGEGFVVPDNGDGSTRDDKNGRLDFKGQPSVSNVKLHWKRHRRPSSQDGNPWFWKFKCFGSYLPYPFYLRVHPMNFTKFTRMNKKNKNQGSGYIRRMTLPLRVNMYND